MEKGEVFVLRISVRFASGTPLADTGWVRRKFHLTNDQFKEHAMPSKPEAPKMKKTHARPLNRDTVSRGPVSREKSHARSKLPHERDEVAERAKKSPDPDIEQAYKDLESGKADTDLRGAAGRNFERAPTRPRKTRPS
jgi:hypothetical protein